MCVIIVAKTNRPDLATIEKCDIANPDGIGIAYRENGHIVWFKGMKPAEAFKRSQEAPLPFVLHFRLASAGSALDKTLNHPFPISKSAFPIVKGTASRVLFHNGHIPEWEGRLFAFLAANGNKKKYSGSWSDTRLASLMAWRHGDDCLAGLFPGQKFVIFDTKSLRLVGPWPTKEENGMLFSNNYWKNTQTTYAVTGKSYPVKTYRPYKAAAGDNRGYLTETFNDREFQRAMMDLRGD